MLQVNVNTVMYGQVGKKLAGCGGLLSPDTHHRKVNFNVHRNFVDQLRPLTSGQAIGRRRMNVE